MANQGNLRGNRQAAQHRTNGAGDGAKVQKSGSSGLSPSRFKRMKANGATKRIACRTPNPVLVCTPGAGVGVPSGAGNGGPGYQSLVGQFLPARIAPHNLNN